MTKQVLKKKGGNPLTIEGVTNTDMAPPKNTFTEFKKKTISVLKHYEEENYKKSLEVDMYREGAYFTKLERDKIKEENEKLKARNEYLEKNTGNKQIKEFHNELKKDQLTEVRRQEIESEYEKKKRAFFKSQGISKYLNDSSISYEKKKKS